MNMRRGGELLVVLPVIAVALGWCIPGVEAATGLQPPVKLELHYYKKHNTCHEAEVYVRHQVGIFWSEDKSITAKLLRLLYSDCFPTGCDASILLDGEKSEKTAPQNSGFEDRVFIVIDKIKTVMEDRCPGVVSCADILNLATRDAIHLAGGPSYLVYTGRKDGMSSTTDSVDLPSPSISWEAALAYFNSRGLDALDMTTLLGAHSLGQTHCRYIMDRLYNFNNTNKPDPSMNPSLLSNLRKQCNGSSSNPQTDSKVFLNPDSGSGANYGYSNSYYSWVLSHKAVLGVDQQLLLGPNTSRIVQEFAIDFKDLKKSLALSMNRMGNIKVLTGEEGEIRRHCRCTNKQNCH